MNLPDFLMAITPLLGLVAMLLAKHYPGEVTIERLRVLVKAAVSSVARAISAVGRFPGFEFTVRGGRLLGCSLAGRAPPFDS